jgi:hypothetical protein
MLRDSQFSVLAHGIDALTRHPVTGAVEQPEVAVQELYENKRLIEKL